MWFRIKKHSKVTDAAPNLWNTILAVRYLPEHLKTVVHRVIQSNGFYAHSESLLVAMLYDCRHHVRAEAASRILDVRSSPPETVRKFQIPNIDFEADDYVKLIDWDKEEICEPPLTRIIPDANLRAVIAVDTSALKDFAYLFELPNHLQAVERMVKEVTSACQSVIGHKSRDGFIRARLADRAIMKKHDTKSQFQTS